MKNLSLQYLSIETNTSLFDKTVDLHDRIPTYLRALHNFDPTGLASSIDQILAETKAEREQENILRAIYELMRAIGRHSEKIAALEDSYRLQQLPQLTYLYFEYSENTFYASKIELFRNIWLNGLTYVTHRLGEKTSMFEVVDSLTEDDMLVIKLIYDRQLAGNLSEESPVHIDEIAEALEFEAAYVQQICVRLQGRGLLLDYGIGKWGYSGPVEFVITNYTKLLIDYITEPTERVF